MTVSPRFAVLFVSLTLLLGAGCPSPPDDETEDVETPDAGSTTATDEDDQPPEPLLEPFDPPPLEELEASVEWEEGLILDPFDHYREHWAQVPELVTLDTALALRNESPDDNEKILNALGRPPASDSDVDWDASINRHSPLYIKSSNPLLISSRTEMEVADLTGVALLTFDWEFTPFGNSEVIESWQISNDRMYDKIVMRDDMVWSDGEPITAHDVAFSFQAIMNPEVPAVAVRSGTDKLRWVHAYDDQTVVFFHKEPLATNQWNILFPIIPRHVYEESMREDPTLSTSDYHLNLEQHPIAGGPYQVTRLVRNQEIVLERREDWYLRDGQQVRQKPYFREVRYRIIEDPNTALLAFKGGEIDEYELRAEQWTTQTVDEEYYENNTKAYGTEWTYGYIGWNVETPYFEDRRVRQAMAYALDHREMIETICFNLYEPGQGIFHPTSWMFPEDGPEPYQQDLDRAEELLDAAGWADSDGDGIRDKVIDGRKTDFEFNVLLPSGSETGERILELLKNNLDQIGVICNIRPTEFTVLQENARTHKFQALTMAFGTGTDPYTNENLWTTEAINTGGRNYSLYSNPEVDALFEAGGKEFDREKRAEIYGRIHNILWEDQPFMWLYYRSGFFGFNKDLRGYMFSPRGPYGYAPGFLSLWKPAN